MAQRRAVRLWAAAVLMFVLLFSDAPALAAAADAEDADKSSSTSSTTSAGALDVLQLTTDTFADTIERQTAPALVRPPLCLACARLACVQPSSIPQQLCTQHSSSRLLTTWRCSAHSAHAGQVCCCSRLPRVCGARGGVRQGGSQPQGEVSKQPHSASYPWPLHYRRRRHCQAAATTSINSPPPVRGTPPIHAGPGASGVCGLQQCGGDAHVPELCSPSVSQSAGEEAACSCFIVSSLSATPPASQPGMCWLTAGGTHTS